MRELLERNALAQETMGVERLFAVKERMEQAEARRLQPYFVRSFFLQAFAGFGGVIHPREAGRFEITHVPALLRERDRRITGRNRRDRTPVLKRYERVCFTRDAIRPLDKPGLTPATLLHPGHPLLLALSDVLLEQQGHLLRQGAVLVDPADEGEIPALLLLLAHAVQSGDGQTLSKRLHFVKVTPEGQATFAGWAPHLDLQPLDPADRPLLKEVLDAPWLRVNLEQRGLALAATTLAPEHYREVAERRVAEVEKTLAAVHERLSKEINFWSDRWLRLKDDQEAGKDVRLNLENVRWTISDLEGRLANRQQQLQAMRQVVSATPVVLGGALIVPAGWLRQRRGEPVSIPTFAADAAARARIERLAMAAVRRAEEARGCRVVDVSAQQCGWDLTAYPPPVDGKPPPSRHIEVKGRVKGATTITVTRNEMLYALNQVERFWLAIVLIGDDDAVDGPFYLQNPFDAEPAWGVASINYDLKALLARSARA